MFKNRKIQLLGIAVLIVVAALVTISAVKPSAQADLSWPPRPDFSILSQNIDASVNGNSVASDYYLRHPELNERAGAAADMSDYSLRHTDLFQKANVIDSSDYFLRHR